MIRRISCISLLLCACGAESEAPAPPAQMSRAEEETLKALGYVEGGTYANDAAEPEAAGTMAPMARTATAKKEKGRADEDQRGPGAEAKPEPEAPTTRAWFPETFLFEPLVVTDAQGLATVDARVPDRLTTWRVLGLAATREGGLSGAVTSFLGTLPVYVDPVLPPTLMSGDQLNLPVQVVNTTGEAREARLSVSARGAASGAGGGLVRVPAYGSVVVSVPVTAKGAGQATISATLEGADAIERTLSVLPTGRPQELTRGGTLAAPRTLTISGPADLDPQSARVRLVVYPGALSLLRSELEDALSRGGAPGDAYALLLTGQGPDLLRKLGEEPDAKAARAQSLLASQRALRHTMAPDVPTSALFAEAALAHPENPVMARLADRLLMTLATQQRPDGSFGGEDGWTVQRLLMMTADASAAFRASRERGAEARQRADRALLRASGAFERLTPQIQDPCTAAAVLQSGAAPPALAKKLRETVRGAVQTRPDGSRYLPATEGAVRSDGLPLTELECTSLAILALNGDPETPWLADLGATVLAGWHPGWGWGDGRASLLALRAALAVFSEPIPEGVQVSLLLDGQPVLQGALSGDRRKEVVVLDAPAAGAAGEHTWTVQATPAVPGLGYQLALQSWVPWTGAVASPGATLDVVVPETLARGAPAELIVRSLAPAGLALVTELRLPAGVTVDEPQLDSLVSEGRLSGWESEDGLLTLRIPALGPGQLSDLRLRVIPTLSGALQSGALTLSAAGAPAGQALVSLAPRTWRVR